MQETSNAIQPDRRAELARQQAALVRALTRNEALPAGFSSTQLAIAAESLARKRSRSISKSWPKLVRALGSQFDEHFLAYAADNPSRAEGNDEDASHFAHWLLSRGLLSHEARIELAIWRASNGFPLQLRLVANANELVLVYRIARTVRVARVSIPRRTHVNPR